MTTWIFVRHGESEANRLHEFSNTGEKHPLTATGREQAAELAQKLKVHPIAAIFSSPLLRARQTAGIIASEFGILPRIAPALIEFDTGVLEGKSDPQSWTFFEEVLQDWLMNQNYERRFEAGDSFTSIRDRFIPFFQELQRAYAGSRQTLLFVGHGGTYLCMLPILLKNINFEYASAHRLSHSGMVIAEEQDSEFICKVWDGQVIIEP